MQQRYEAVLFDFDGVIVDSEPVHYRCWCEVLATIGITFDWDYYHQNFIGVSDRRMAEELGAMADPPRAAEEIYALYPRKTEIFRERMQHELPFAAGIAELLPQLHAYKLAVVSSSRASEVAPVLIAGGLMDRLDTTVFGDDVTRHKPDPEPYLKAASLLGVTRALVVEDSEAGQASGLAAGFDVVRIPTPDQTAELVRRHLGLL